MTTTDGAQALDDLLDAPVIVMLMTMIGDEHSSRPLTCVAVHEECLDFLVDQETEWAQAIAAGTARVHVTVADERHNTYVSLNGPATLSTDRDEIDRLWNPAAGSFFSGPDDPGLAVLHVEAANGEYWDGPSGRLGTAIGLLRARMTGNPADAGEHGDLAT